jgi:hypothetical protein
MYTISPLLIFLSLLTILANSLPAENFGSRFIPYKRQNNVNETTTIFGSNSTATVIIGNSTMAGQLGKVIVSSHTTFVLVNQNSTVTLSGGNTTSVIATSISHTVTPAIFPTAWNNTVAKRFRDESQVQFPIPQPPTTATRDRRKTQGIPSTMQGSTRAIPTLWPTIDETNLDQ